MRKRTSFKNGLAVMLQGEITQRSNETTVKQLFEITQDLSKIQD